MPNKPKPVPNKGTDDKSTKPVDKIPNKKKETKSETFFRIAKPRVESVKNALRILSNCSNRNNYEYNSKQIDEMFESISESYSECLSMFSKTKSEKVKFNFSS